MKHINLLTVSTFVVLTAIAGTNNAFGMFYQTHSDVQGAAKEPLKTTKTSGTEQKPMVVVPRSAEDQELLLAYAIGNVVLNKSSATPTADVLETIRYLLQRNKTTPQASASTEQDSKISIGEVTIYGPTPVLRDLERLAKQYNANNNDDDIFIRLDDRIILCGSHNKLAAVHESLEQDSALGNKFTIGNVSIIIDE